MGLRPGVFLLGLLLLLLLLEQGTTQIHSSPGKKTLEGQQWFKLQILKNLPIPCNPKKLRLNMASKSVHSLRPSDIKVVAAIGNLETLLDSGMVDLEERERTEERPDKACMRVMTDIFRHFSPSVLMPECPPRKSGVSHHGVEGLWTQAEELVKRLEENLQLDFRRDWKLINVFFSNTSQCHLCPFAEQKRQVTSGMEELAAVLDYLRQEVPKAFVNLVDLSKVAVMLQGHQGTQLSSAEPEPCNCSGETSNLAKAVMQWAYQDAWESLLASSRFSGHKSFAVVFQPFFCEMLPPLERPLCQDPTTLALSLWNSMMEPVGQKDEPLSTTERWLMKCPSQESPYLYTYVNSNYWNKLLNPPERLEEKEGTEITCPDKDPSESVPTSVHRLKPADIKVVGALGDSITAGNGAGSRPGDIRDVSTEYRGLSWSIGGDQDIKTVITLPNILREFNPDLKGFSTGTGKQDTPGAFFNQAVAGAKAENLLTQANKLVELMKKDTRINFQEDWKIITVFIGGNDICAACNDPAHHSPHNFTDNIRKALDILHAEVPRAFVNMVKVLEIVSLRELFKATQDIAPKLALSTLCPCVVNVDDDSAELNTLVDLNKKYQEGTEQLVGSGRYDTKDDFTVVVQPFLENVDMPKTSEGLPDTSYFAPDHFHFSSKSHAHTASGLWENMLEPVGQKTTQHDFEAKINIVCPKQNSPFLSTYKNSMQNHGTEFSCTDRTPSASPPTSVHALRPADIKVVAALGDSVTAGNGISSRPDDLPDVATQYRGLSYSSGGDGSLESVTTLPNILREFNSNLTGYAVGTGEAKNPNAFLNQAVPGAKTEDLVNQVQILVQKMKSDDRIKFQEDWKVITVLIGTNDLCDHCKDLELYSADNFMKRLRNALDILHKEVPRALVNLLDFMSPSVMRQVFLGNPDKCPVIYASMLCKCILTPLEKSQELATLEVLTEAYQSSMRQLVNSGRYDSREDFTVVLQPFLHKVQLPSKESKDPDTSLFAPDCIHPNQKFHSQLARTLWVNMLEPLGRKTDTLDLTTSTPLTCPTQEEPFLRTFQNSNSTYPTNEPTSENWGSDFLCLSQESSGSVPTSVHKLRPADIKVVAALGDSLTTAMEAQPSDPSKPFMSWHGLSWSIGGDGVLENHTTLPNILKKFNPSIFGFSTSSQEEETVGLNMAVEGARAKDMPAQAKNLVLLMKNSPKINVEEDWKLITLFVGVNDLCHYCENPEDHSTEKYVQYIQQTLDIFYEELPRAFINVVEIPEVTGLYQDVGKKCTMLLATHSHCACSKYSQNSLEMQELKRVNWDLQSGISKFSYWHRYMEREDFAVVVQTFLQNTLIPPNQHGGTDLSFFTEDCLYFTERGHAEMAIGLWNNMLEPVGQKTTTTNFIRNRTKLKCLSDNQYLYTVWNSGLLPEQAEEASGVSYWTLLMAIILGILIGVLVMMLYKGRRRQQRENPPTSVKASEFPSPEPQPAAAPGPPQTDLPQETAEAAETPETPENPEAPTEPTEPAEPAEPSGPEEPEEPS